MFRGGGWWHIYIIFPWVLSYYFIKSVWFRTFICLLKEFFFVVALCVSLARSFRAAGGGICWVIGPLFRSDLLVRAG